MSKEPRRVRPAGAKKIKLVFGRDMCVTKTLPASVGFVRFSWTNPARNGLHPSRKSGIGAFSTVQGPGCTAAQPGPVLMRAEDCRWREGRVCTAASVGACRGQPSAGRLLDGGVTREGGPHQFNLKMLDGLQNRPTSPKSVQTNAGPGCREAAGAVSCEGDCKPGSVSDSHLSRRAVANAFKPPPKDGRAGHLSFPRCCSG